MNEPAPQSPMVEVALARIVYREGSPQQYIHLRERAGERTFAIVIGTAEASEIHRVVSEVEMPRPLTHQLAHQIVEAVGWELTGVDIVNLLKNTFYAELLLHRCEGGEDGEERRVDARPSDAIAIALRAGCPIRVAESVIEQVRIDKAVDPLPEESDEPDSDEPDGDASDEG